MAMTLQLSGVDRDFFTLVAQAVASNPFSEARLQFDRQMSGCGEEVPTTERVARLARTVSERVQQLENQGAADLRRYSGEERELVREAMLFDLYHRYMDGFDQLILEQVAGGELAVPVRFATEAVALLMRHGFDRAEAYRLLAILYQLRRAYYFIDRGLVGRSSCLQEFRRRLWNNVFTHDIRAYEAALWNRLEDFSTLLLGETGTGKGTAAAAIGRSGFIPFDEKKGCFTESFVRSFTSLNLSQFPEALIESELFGHKKGAFTGAVDNHEGAFARCSPHGAIFLDEIGEITVPVQIKLLQVLQERTFCPVGSHQRQRFRGRVIAATNQRLPELRAAGRFRDDFFYRLCSDVITVPPLRQRIAEEPQELDDLIASILQRVAGTTVGALELRDRLLACVGRDYPWPGNVRELEQALRRLLLSGSYEGDHGGVGSDLRSRLSRGIESGKLDADALLASYCTLLYERYGTIEEVARRTNLDRRTVKAYLAKQQ